VRAIDKAEDEKHLSKAKKGVQGVFMVNKRMLKLGRIDIITILVQ
jgi:hypothetical protein